jgi:CRISPR-associated protein Cmr5
MPESSPRTREQLRAAKAHEIISNIKSKSKPENEVKSFGRQCLRLPALIHQCGLCQAIAFLEAKAKGKDNEFKKVVESLAHVIGAPMPESQRLNGNDFAKQVREASMVEYQWLTREALKASQWLKRYSEAILGAKATDEDRSAGGE